MKSMNTQRKPMPSQAGFTIIELVVVILLLGILTATALPRFLDASDDAHGAVVTSTAGSFRSGIELFKAGWQAEGQPTTAVTNFGDGGLIADATSGYPVDSDDGTMDPDAVDCLAVFDEVVNTSLGTVGVAAPITDQTTESAVESAAGAAIDFVITPDDDTTATGCNFYYVGQFKEGNSVTNRTIRMITYTFSTGAVAETTYTLDQDT
jgi:MSHA pilin protein MshB